MESVYSMFTPAVSDELSDLRGQVKLLEDKNTKYMQENLEIQEVGLNNDYL